MSLFWNASERRLRAFWRLLAQAAFMVALGLVPILGIAEPLTALHRRGIFLPTFTHDNYDRVINILIGPLLVAAVIASVAMAAKWLDHRRFTDFGVRLDPAWWSGLGLGLALGAVVMGLVFAVEYALGWITLTGTVVSNVVGVPLGLAFTFSAIKVLCVGTYEEFLSRGYHLRNMTEGLGLPWGVVASSSVFALLHLANENANVLNTLGLFVNALFFAAGILVTGRLSTAIGAHIAWNFLQGTVFGFPVSGDKEAASLIAIQQGGPPLWTGGAFGPEAGLIGVLASLAGIGVLVAWGRSRRVAHPRAA